MNAHEWSGASIFACGFRNPFGLSVGADGTVWATENGADAADEIDRIEPGANYGWPEFEGRSDYYPASEPCERADDFHAPAFSCLFGLGWVQRWCSV